MLPKSESDMVGLIRNNWSCNQRTKSGVITMINEKGGEEWDEIYNNPRGNQKRRNENQNRDKSG